jgi:hypothetical protein
MKRGVTLFGARKFEFNDSLFNGHMRILEELCDLILADGLQISWGGQGVIRAATPNASLTVGQETDLLARWQASKHIDLLAGYSHFFAGPFIEDSGSSDDADFFYFQTTLKF